MRKKQEGGSGQGKQGGAQVKKGHKVKILENWSKIGLQYFKRAQQKFRKVAAKTGDDLFCSSPIFSQIAVKMPDLLSSLPICSATYCQFHNFWGILRAAWGGGGGNIILKGQLFSSPPVP